MPSHPSKHARRRGFVPALSAALSMAAISLALCLLSIEATFRLFPAALPAGVYGFGVRHPELGMNVHGTRLIYNKVRYVTRAPNHEGFLDADHERTKLAGVSRVGFFGDSYVEAAQVPLEAVFYRRLGSALAPGVETLGFGMSGWGTVQGLRAFQTFAPTYGLDGAIYVFVENDLGDQLYDLAVRTRGASSAYPFAQIEDDAPHGFRERWVLEPGGEPLGWRIAKRIQRHSLLAHVVRERLSILGAYGVRLRADRSAQQMTQATQEVPRSTDLPGTWPEAWASPARELGRRVLAAWASEARDRSVRFAVLYVPRSEEQLLGRIPLEQTWKPWLEATCAELGIEILDPSEALRARLESGDAVYDDHWTPAGHEVVAGVLAGFVPRWLAGPDGR